MSIFLGTGASEGIPAAYCDCPTCHRARELGGKDIRTRSSFYIGEESMIDPGPDFYCQVTTNRLFMRGLKHILVTHSHEDHISIPELGARNSAIPTPEEPVTIYGSEKALGYIQDMMLRYLPSESRDKPNHCFSPYRFEVLTAYNEYTIGNMTVIPIFGSHHGTVAGEMALNYLITDAEGRRFLYATDTGWYSTAAWDYLAEHRVKLDYLVMECTYGTWELRRHNSGHTDYQNLLLAMDEFEKHRCINKNTPVYVTHVSHLNAHSHEEMQAFFDSQPWNLIAAYDGMRI